MKINKVDNGICYELHGHGPVKVIVGHMWLGTKVIWNHVRELLNEERFTLALTDCRGYGMSKDIPGQYNSDEWAADLFKVAEHLGWDEFHIISHSMSGMVAQKMLMQDAKNKKKKIQSAVMIAPVTGNGFPSDQELYDFVHSLIHVRELTMEGLNVLTGGRLSAEWRGVLADRINSTSDAKAMDGYFYMWMDEDFSAGLQGQHIDTPILLVIGRQDHPGFGEAHYRRTLYKWFPNINPVVIDDAGHLPMYETPIYLASLIINHFDNYYADEAADSIDQINCDDVLSVVE